MGNSSSPAKFYANSDIKLENHIRDFELDMGFFRYDFNFIFSKIFIENNKLNIDFNNMNNYADQRIKIKNINCEIKSTNENLKNYYPTKIISFLDNSFFKTKDYKYYDSKNLQALLFLISKDSSGKDAADSYLFYQNKVKSFLIILLFKIKIILKTPKKKINKLQLTIFKIMNTYENLG